MVSKHLAVGESFCDFGSRKGRLFECFHLGINMHKPNKGATTSLACSYAVFPPGDYCNCLCMYMQMGDVVQGVVQIVKPYGVFVDIGGLTGLLHVSQISNDRVTTLDKIFNEGDKIKVGGRIRCPESVRK